MSLDFRDISSCHARQIAGVCLTRLKPTIFVSSIIGTYENFGLKMFGGTGTCSQLEIKELNLTSLIYEFSDCQIIGVFDDKSR